MLQSIDTTTLDEKDMHPIKLLDSDLISPTAEIQRQYRDMLGGFATGVTIIAIDTESGPVGMTVNSFSSVSLDPPLIQWAVAKSAGRYKPFVSTTEFSVNVLRAHQARTAYDFAGDAQAFTPQEWVLKAGNPPRLKNALASIRCSVEETFEGGDHSIIIGRVIDGSYGDGDPLVFFKGKFGQFVTLEN